MKSSMLTSFMSLFLMAAALPMNDSPQTRCNSESTVATFDDRQPLPLVSQVNPVNLYRGLRYNSFNIINPGVPALLPGLSIPPPAGILPQSGNIAIGNSIFGDVLAGEPAFYAATIPSFDLEELYFGCSLATVTSLATVPIPCTIAFTGVKKNVDAGGGSRTTITFQFNPENPVISHLTRAGFKGPAWTDLYKVEVAVAGPIPAALSVLFVDSIKYKNCTM